MYHFLRNEFLVLVGFFLEFFIGLWVFKNLLKYGLGVLFCLTHLLGSGYRKFMLLSFSVET